MCLINVEVELEVGSFGGKAVGIKKAVEKGAKDKRRSRWKLELGRR